MNSRLDVSPRVCAFMSLSEFTEHMLGKKRLYGNDQVAWGLEHEITFPCWLTSQIYQKQERMEKS